MYYRWLNSPVADLLLTSDGRSLIGLHLKGQKYMPTITSAWQEMPQLELFEMARTQLEAYFNNQRFHFDLPLAPQGTEFQKHVWQQLCQIPFGQTRSYADLAQRIGQPTAYRAVGAANGRNPIAIITPCHRVVATNGQLTGYAGGLDRKQWLLQHEQAAIAAQLTFWPA